MGLRSSKKSTVTSNTKKQKSIYKASAKHIVKRPIQKSTLRSSVNKKSDLILSGVKITHPEKIIMPAGISKGALAQYYDKIAEEILPYIKNRPLLILRCPTGTRVKCFYQKHRYDTFPKSVLPVDVIEAGTLSSGTVSIRKSQDPSIDNIFLMVNDKKGLLSLIQFNVIEIHPWGSIARNLEKPDRIIFDLDPSPEISWRMLVESAILVRDELHKIGLKSFVKTTGGKGLHIVIPLKPNHNWDTIKEFCRNFAQMMTYHNPNRFIATISKKARVGKILIDYLRNGRGSTSVAAFSTRSHPEAPISTPLFWAELSKIRSAQTFNISNILDRIEKNKKLGKDPWEGFYQTKQNITKKMLLMVQKSMI